MGDLSNFQECREYLYALRNRGSRLGLDRMRLFVEALDYPQFDFPVIHVAGTNGKGSTCAILESIFRYAGYRTGMFTSPHLVFLGERIQCNRIPLTPDQMVAYTRELRSVAATLAQNCQEQHPTFFELMTAMAFLHFSRSKVEIGIFETGLGGRLDSTNVVDPLVSIITSIGMDHMQQLGNTLAAIAGEKAGIIKPGKPVVIGDLPSEADVTIARIAEERGCKLLRLTDTYGYAEDNLPHTALGGVYQRKNAGVASIAVDLLQGAFPKLTKRAVDHGLQTVRWAARWQSIALASGHSLILDATHNAEGAAQLHINLQQLREQTGCKPIVLVGVVGQERAESLLPVVAEHAAEIIVLVPNQPRACSFQEVRAQIPTYFAGTVRQGSVAALFPAVGTCSLSTPAYLVATGSIYLMGEILERITQGTLSTDALQDQI